METPTRDLQKVQLYILKKVVDLCEKNDIKYFLHYGTLLGSIRHQGFIPWDDDIDITMKRNDYNLFLDIAKNKLSEEFFVQHYTTDKNYTRVIIKIRLNSTTHIEPAFEGVDIHQGVYIDIFPLDLASNSKIKRKFNKQTLMMLSRILSTRNSTKVINNPVKKAIKSIIRPFLLLLPKRYINMLFDVISTWDESGDYLACYTGAYNIDKDTYPKSWFDDEDTFMMFEGNSYRVPSEYDLILSKLYGNYLELPPEDKRITHNIVKLDLGKYKNMLKESEL